jgi:transposase-like protein
MVTERTKIYGDTRTSEGQAELSPSQFIAIGLLLAGRTYADVAREVGIDTSTLYRWRHEPAFAAELRSQFDLMHAATRYGLFSLAADAITALRTALKGQNETARVSAAEIVLDRLGVGRRSQLSADLVSPSEAGASLLDAEIQARARGLLQDEFRGLDDGQVLSRVRALLAEHAKP